MVMESAETSVSEYLQNLVLDSGDVQEFLDELARLSAASFSSGNNVVLCGITLLRERKAATVASSGEEALAMDELQYAYTEGPCLTAAREQATVVVRDVQTETRWPDYISAVRGHGMRSILAVPFRLDGEARAALNLYSGEADRFDAPAVATAESFARQTSHALRLAVRFAQHSETAANLRAALESRTTIDLAVGIVMGQNRCSQEAAIRILQSASSHRNIKLRDVAAALVSSTGQGPVTTHFDD